MGCGGKEQLGDEREMEKKKSKDKRTRREVEIPIHPPAIPHPQCILILLPLLHFFINFTYKDKGKLAAKGNGRQQSQTTTSLLPKFASHFHATKFPTHTRSSIHLITTVLTLPIHTHSPDLSS